MLSTYVHYENSFNYESQCSSVAKRNLAPEYAMRTVPNAYSVARFRFATIFHGASASIGFGGAISISPDFSGELPYIFEMG